MKWFVPIERFLEALAILWVIDLIVKAPAHFRRNAKQEEPVNQS